MPKFADRDKSGGKPFRKESETMDTIFETLQQTAQRLNTTADAANELIRGANDRLAAIGAGVAYSSDNVRLGNEDHSRHDESSDELVDRGYGMRVMSYGKIHGMWQLGVELRHFQPSESGEPGEYDFVGAEESPLLAADRELRIRAASKLPEFLKEYTRHLEDLAGQLDD